MTTEENSLPTELEKLEIVSGRVSMAQHGDENPFQKRGISASRAAVLWSSRCNCANNRRAIRNSISFKRNNSRLLKEPVLKYANLCCHNAKHDELANPALHSVSAAVPQQARDSVRYHTGADRNGFQDLISERDHLRIAPDYDTGTVFASPSFLAVQSGSAERPNGMGFASASPADRASASCSQQALNPSCDITIDELASYFETLVHIPKKMSSMAEMMYT